MRRRIAVAPIAHARGVLVSARQAELGGLLWQLEQEEARINASPRVFGVVSAETHAWKHSGNSVTGPPALFLSSRRYCAGLVSRGCDGSPIPF